MRFKELFSVKNMAVTAMLAALAIVLYHIIELSLNPFAPFLKVNFSDIPAIIAGLTVSPAAGIFVTLIRCVAHLFRTSTFGIGEFADFTVGTSIVLAFCFAQRVYSKKLDGVKLNCLIVFITLIAAVCAGYVVNIFIYPLYMFLMGSPVESASALFFYLGATVITNVERILLNVILCLFLVPFVPKFKKTLNNVR